MKANKITYTMILIIFFISINMSGVRAQEGISIPILMYHNLTDNEGLADGLNVQKDSFESQIQYLKIHGYNTIDFKDLKNFFEGKSDLPPNPIIITFDDGYVSNYTYGYPILKKYGFKAVIFMITNYIGSEGYLDLQMLQEGEANKVFDIQSHSVNHLYELSTVSKNKMISEVKNSKETLEELLNKSVNAFCYPYGRNSNNLRDVLNAQGYDFAVTTEYGVAGKNEDHYRLKRIRVLGTDTGKSLKGRIEKNTQNYTHKIISDIQINDKDLVISIEAVQNGWIELVDGYIRLDTEATKKNFLKGLSNILKKEIVVQEILDENITIIDALEVINNIISAEVNFTDKGNYKEIIETELLNGLMERQYNFEDDIDKSRNLSRRDIVVLFTILQETIESYEISLDIVSNIIDKESSLFILENYYSEDENAPNELYILSDDEYTFERITNFNSINDHVLDVKELYISPTYDWVLLKTELLFDETMLVFMLDLNSIKTQFVKKTTIQESIECIYWLNSESFALQIKDNNGVKILIYDNNNVLLEAKKLNSN